MNAIAIFNNKGGVGKTTLLCNFASYLQKRLEKKSIGNRCGSTMQYNNVCIG